MTLHILKRNQLIFVIFIISALLLSGCILPTNDPTATTMATEAASPVVTPSPQPTPVPTPVPNLSTYNDYMIDGGSSDAYNAESPVAVIQSLKDLYDYYDAYAKDYDLYPRHSGRISHWLDVLDHYTLTFFRDHTLLIVQPKPGSSSIHYQVHAIGQQNDRVHIQIYASSGQVQTTDIVSRLVMVELPKNTLSASDYTVETTPVVQEREDVAAPPDRIVFHSADVSVAPYEHTLWTKVYDEDGDKTYREYDEVTISEIMNKIPALTLSSNLDIDLLMKGYIKSNRIKIYNERLRRVGSPSTITYDEFMDLGPGSYYLAFKTHCIDAVLPDIDKENTSSHMYYIRIDIPEDYTGLAAQVESLTGIELHSLDSLKVMFRDTEDETLRVNGSLYGMIGQLGLCDQGMPVPVEETQNNTPSIQLLRKNEKEPIITIHRADDGIYLSTQDQHYLIYTAPWVYDQLLYGSGYLLPAYEEALTMTAERLTQSQGAKFYAAPYEVQIESDIVVEDGFAYWKFIYSSYDSSDLDTLLHAGTLYVNYNSASITDTYNRAAEEDDDE